MATPTIPRPGVKVFQQFQEVSPTIIVPSLPAVVVGVAKQVVEAVQDDGSLNTDSFITLPARLTLPFVSSPFEYTGVGGTTLQLSLNNGPTVTITFPAAPANPTPTDLKNYIDSQAIPGLVTVVEESGSQERLVLETTAQGQFAKIELVGGTILALSPLMDELGEGGFVDVGLDGYDNRFQAVPFLADYPDPRDNLDELVIDYDTVRVFFNTGNGSFVELLRDRSFLRGDTAAVSVFDDGDGDNLSPYLDFAGAQFEAFAASLTGSVDLTTLTYGGGGDFDPGGTLDLSFDGGVAVPVTLDTSIADETALVGAINAAVGSTVASLDGSNQLVLTSTTTGVGSSVEVLASSTASVLTAVGLTANQYASGGPSRARVQGSADISALIYPADVGGLSLDLSIDGGEVQRVTFDAATVDENSVVTQINDLFGATIASLNDGNQLVLESTATWGGEESVVRVLDSSSTTLLTNLGLTAGRTAGSPFPVQVGDQVWVDGSLVGLVTEVVSATRLRMDSEQLLTFTGARYYIIALADMDNQFATMDRPSSELVVDVDSGTVTIKHEYFRDTSGAPTDSRGTGIYLGYTALRQDVSPVGEDFTILRSGSLTSLESQLSPIDTQNPLGLGMFFAQLNAPGIEILGLGVDEDSATEPDGTLDGWIRAYEFLESKDVYAIAQLSHSVDVAQAGAAHVTAMSDPENGLERVLFFNPTRPTRNSNTLVASGALGNAVASTSVLDTGIPNLPALIAGAGLGPGPYTIDDALFLELESDTNKYLITAVAGSQVTVSTGPLAGNDDAFYFEGTAPAFASAIVDRPFTVAVRGASIANLTEEATAYADIARSFLNRRVIVQAPDKLEATIDGLEQIIEGYYGGAAAAGLTASSAPQTPLTNVGLTGFSGVRGSNDRYSELQLKIMDGGGLWVLVQETDGGPVTTRHQLTSDMSSIEVREFSIVKAIDFTAKFVRQALRNFIGRFNITQGVQDSVNSVLDGIGKFLTEQGALASFTINRLVQDPDQPDRLLIDVTIGVLYPLNEIRVTLII